MKPTKKIEAAVLDVYHKWLHSYLNGDVKTYDSYFDNAFHFIGSTDNEEFLNRKDTTKFFEATAEQFSGKTQLRNETKIIEQFGELVIITHIFDAWFSNGEIWNFYDRFRFSNVLEKNNEGWHFVYQHYSTPDSKAQEGETLGFDKVSKENLELREAIKRRTVELEAKNRELEIEGALQRIRAQAVAMQQSSDLLDIVVTMRNEFTKLGHEAHYFWHMMWLPETYEKAMTSGDGSKIGFVMTLPRHMHGDIPLLANWEESDDATVIYPMNVKAAISYVDKMVKLGDFKNIDPQAPTHDDIKHIGGLTFIMARTTHGEIGYSLPGVAKNPPAEDVQILVQFAGAFDLAHRRFLDLQKAEKQAREVQIELALEKVRSRTMAMHHSDELQEASFLLDQQVRALGIKTRGCAFNIYGQNDATEWFSSEEGTMPVYRTPRENVFLEYYEAGKRGESMYIKEFEGDACAAHYDYLCTLPVMGEALRELKANGGSFPKKQIDHATFFKYGYLLFITLDFMPEAHDIFKRFAKVFEQTYTRFLDLQKAEAQAREAQIEASLERVRAKAMAMHQTDELTDVLCVLFDQFDILGINPVLTHLTLFDEENETFSLRITSTAEKRIVAEQYIDINAVEAWKDSFANWKKSEPNAINCIDYEPEALPYVWDLLSEVMKALPEGHKIQPTDFPGGLFTTQGHFKFGYIGYNHSRKATEEEKEIVGRFAREFGRTYQRFLDLEKAEAQAREAQIEAALERVRAQSNAMHKSEDLANVVSTVYEELRLLNSKIFRCGIGIINEKLKNVNTWITSDLSSGTSIELSGNEPLTGHPLLDLIFDYWMKQKNLSYLLEGKDLIEYYKTVIKTDFQKHFAKEGLENANVKQYYHCTMFAAGGLFVFDSSPISKEQINVLQRFTDAFNRAYTRHQDLQKAEAQAKEAQIEAALEKVRSRSLAMHKPNELQEVVAVVAEKLKDLGVIFDAGGVILCTYFPDNKDVVHWISVDDFSSSGRYFVPYFDNPIFNDAWDSKTKGDAYFSKSFTVKAKNEFFKHAFANSDYKQMPDDYKQFVLKAESHNLSAAWSKNSAIIIPSLTGTTPSESDAEILKRFAKVFEQAYIRFLDLQKAEAQAREAQIEAALEKVRSRTMAMQKGQEVKDVVVLLYKELIALGVTNFASCGYVEINEETNRQETWVTNPGGDSLGLFHLPLTGDVHFDARYVAWKNQQTVFQQTVGGAERRKHLEYAITTFNSKEAEEMVRNQFPDPTVFYCFNFSHGYLHLVTGSQLTQNEEALLARFTKVFEQTYARFLDLKKAEAQAREAQIEAALEKVRSRSLAMQKSDELLDVIGIVSEQLHALRLKFDTICFGESNKDGAVKFWLTSKGLPKPILVDVPPIKNKGVQRVVKAQKDGLKFLADVVTGKTYTEWNNHMLTNSQLQYLPKAAKTYLAGTSGFARSSFFLKEIALYAMNYQIEPFSDADNAIFNRFAQVFDQSYTRFLDLKKAEAQAREAQIETALEKVRSRSMAMQKSDELKAVVSEVFEKLKGLNIAMDAACIYTFTEGSKDRTEWVANPELLSAATACHVPFINATMYTEFMDAWEQGQDFFIRLWTEEEKNAYWKLLFEHSDYKNYSDEVKKIVFDSPGWGVSGGISKNSATFLVSYSEKYFSEEENEIVKRFGKVFEQAYTRFLDLKKAEAQAREAQIEAALEKVRSRSLEMSESSEMQNVANEILKQLRAVGLKIDALAMSGVIDNDSDYDVWVGGANSKKPLRIPYNNETQVQREFNKAIKERPEFFAKTYTGKVMKDYFKALMGTGNSFNPEIVAFMKTCTGFTTTLSFMKNSGIQLIRYSEEAFSKEDNAVIVRFGKVFEQAYIRFLDLQKAEEQTILAQQNLIKLQAQKQRAEEALSELQQTQTQLIQSEKMASLGELTAGIAHEIQNPLNFVNNFSEVSKELLEEMQVEIENEDFEEVKAIMADVIQNLEKINHHGKRADAIVKGMLQHSRSSSGTKEPTDINALADEYLRLAYHGLRAKDKSFNATLETDFDKHIGKVNIMPQDMGRVILNLITNAFYAVNEKKQQKPKDYKPTVTVSTKRVGDKIEIKVTDNGNGIPKQVIDKVFQPFFTTKPTGQGTGLGLSMSYDIITKGHGGELHVETIENEGTQFNITLPV